MMMKTTVVRTRQRAALNQPSLQQEMSTYAEANRSAQEAKKNLPLKAALAE
jgi:hypothetical protein